MNIHVRHHTPQTRRYGAKSDFHHCTMVSLYESKVIQCLYILVYVVEIYPTIIPPHCVLAPIIALRTEMSRPLGGWNEQYLEVNPTTDNGVFFCIDTLVEHMCEGSVKFVL